MIITRQDPTLFRLQTGDTVLSFRTDSCAVELKINGKRLVMDTPGEYEMEGVAIEGNAGDNGIFYTIHWDDMIIGLGNPVNPASGGINGVSATYDILLLFVAKPQETIKSLANMDARVLIPFGEEKLVAPFLKEMDETPEEMEKLTIKKKEIPPEGKRRIVILKPLKK